MMSITISHESRAAPRHDLAPEPVLALEVLRLVVRGVVPADGIDDSTTSGTAT